MTTNTPATRQAVVPPELLLDFLYKATKELEELTIDVADDSVPPSRGDIRHLLLQRQHDVLNQVVDEFNNNNRSGDDSILSASDVQNKLKVFATKTEAATTDYTMEADIDVDKAANQIVAAAVQKASEALNEAARLAYCQLVLYSGYLQELKQQQNHQHHSHHHSLQLLKKSGGMVRDDILELCGLCTTVLRLPLVQRHLEEPGHGTPLFHAQLLQQLQGESTLAAAAAATTAGFTSIFPHERLERIQRIFLQMMGYHADYGTAEIKRIFYSNADNEFTRDEQVMQVFTTMMTQIQSALSQATAKISAHNFSDCDQGGCTRIVAVDYSEHEIDARTGEVIATTTMKSDGVDTPAVQTMEEHGVADNNTQALRTAAVAAARLQQEILAQILSLPEAERQEELDRAQRVSERVVNKVLQIAPGPGRVAFFQALDADTQRRLALHKLWETHVTSKSSSSSSSSNNHSNDNGPTKIRYAPGFAPE
jgi:hypothetical protein